MRLASINLRRCLGKPAKVLQARFWLAAHKPDFVLAQDPGGAKADLRTVFPGWKLLDATEFVATWQLESIISSKPIYLEPRIALFNYLELVFANAYLCPNKSAKRALSLELLCVKLQKINKKAIVTGDFNLAPEAHDGLFGQDISQWTSTKERSAFQNVLSSCALKDALSPANCGRQEFSLERTINGKLSRFRCDIALIPISLKNYSAQYDHSVRVGKTAFTDHSAIILDWNST